MFDFRVLLIFAGLSVLSYFGCKNTAIGLITEIGFVPKNDSRKYVKPAKIISNWYKLKLPKIPKFLYAELFFALLFALLFPINSIIYLITFPYMQIAGWLIQIHAVLIIINLIYSSICCFHWKKAEKRKK